MSFKCSMSHDYLVIWQQLVIQCETHTISKKADCHLLTQMGQYMSHTSRKHVFGHMRPGKADVSLHIQSDQSHCHLDEAFMVLDKKKTNVHLRLYRCVGWSETSQSIHASWTFFLGYSYLKCWFYLHPIALRMGKIQLSANGLTK